MKTNVPSPDGETPGAQRKSWLSPQRLVFGGIAVWALVLCACMSVPRGIIAPPNTVPGAEFVGSEECATCHSDVTGNFHDATHSRLMAEGANAKNIGCESCHGPGSKHVESGGERGTIVNPKKSPQTCFQCHLDKRGEFSMPHTHPVLEGKVTCTDCHDPHNGDAAPGGATALESINATCAKCHTAQTQHFVFEHGATREGCVTCHSPHGSVNDKMLVARNAALCLQCHAEAHSTNGTVFIDSPSNHNTRIVQGTCWSAGCHEAIHGSNASAHLRY